METEAGHPGDAGGQRDEGSNHRQQSAKEDCRCAKTLKEALRHLQFVLSQENMGAIALYQWPSAVAADLIGDHGAEVAADGAGSRHQDECERPMSKRIMLPGVNQV